MTNQIHTANALQAANNSLQKAFTQKSETPNKLGKEDFLKLMMAQMTHQDPLNPMDSQGMMDQLTSMGSLEQLMNINKNLGTLNTTQADIVRSNAYTYLDKDVKVRGDGVEVTQGKPTGIQYQIPREAEKVRLTVIGPDGQAVRSMELGAQGAGMHEVAWDGRDKQGNPAPDGKYKVQVIAKGAENEEVPVDLFRQGKVSGIRFDGNAPKLKISGEEIDMREVIEMSNRSERIFGNRLPAALRDAIRARPPVTEPRR